MTRRLFFPAAMAVLSLTCIAPLPAQQVRTEKPDDSPECKELISLRDRYGQRVKNANGSWGYSSDVGDMGTVLKEKAAAEANIRILKALQERYTGPDRVPTAAVRAAAYDLTGQIKGKDVSTLPVGLVRALDDNPGTIDVKGTLPGVIHNEEITIENKDAEAGRIAHVINEFEDRIAARCGGEAPPGAGSTGSSSSSSSASSEPTKEEPSGGSNPWAGVWKHPFGTIDLAVNGDGPGIRSEIETMHSFGPAMSCADNSVYFMGTISSNGGGGFGGVPWEGRIYACSTGRTLQGKFDNAKTATTRTGLHRAFFTMTLEKGAIKGTYQQWDGTSSKAAEIWSWTK